jgi:hypothetical protein
MMQIIEILLLPRNLRQNLQLRQAYPQHLVRLHCFRVDSTRNAAYDSV